jgi:hypothetical protein
MSRASYKTLQRAIARDDKHSIESRWAYGRAVLVDPKKMAPSGKSLRNGATEALIADAVAAGTKLSAREIQWRLQAARTYKTINELRSSASQFADWTALVDAGFPAPTVTEVPSPESLLDDIEGTAPEESEQLGLFPPMVRNIPLDRATLRTIVAYTDDMSKMTASYARSDRRRTTLTAQLLAAVNGNLDALYVDALAALNAQTPATA